MTSHTHRIMVGDIFVHTESFHYINPSSAPRLVQVVEVGVPAYGHRSGTDGVRIQHWLPGVGTVGRRTVVRADRLALWERWAAGGEE
jgi:hypothetical protein